MQMSFSGMEPAPVLRTHTPQRKHVDSPSSDSLASRDSVPYKVPDVPQQELERCGPWAPRQQPKETTDASTQFNDREVGSRKPPAALSVHAIQGGHQVVGSRAGSTPRSRYSSSPSRARQMTPTRRPLPVVSKTDDFCYVSQANGSATPGSSQKARPVINAHQPSPKLFSPNTTNYKSSAAIVSERKPGAVFEDLYQSAIDLEKQKLFQAVQAGTNSFREISKMWVGVKEEPRDPTRLPEFEVKNPWNRSTRPDASNKPLRPASPSRSPWHQETAKYVSTSMIRRPQSPDGSQRQM